MNTTSRYYVVISDGTPHIAHKGYYTTLGDARITQKGIFCSGSFVTVQAVKAASRTEALERAAKVYNREMTIAESRK